MEEVEFFSRPQSVAALNKFKGRMDLMQTNDEFELARNGYIQTIIHSMADKPGDWDKFCEINIGWIGDGFISRISDDGEDLTKERLDDIFSMCFRFLFELYLSIKGDLSVEFERAKRFAFDNIDKFDLHAKEQIEYAIKGMPVSIFKTIANSESIESIKDFNRVSRLADSKREEWEKDLLDRENRVEALKQALSTYEAGFNFVGLFEGFDELSREKGAEKDNLLFWLKFLGFLVVSPLMVEIVFLYNNLSDFDEAKSVLALSIIPTVSLVAIFIYYFRVVLFNFKSTKSQLLQIELRKTLCRFIQHYSEYSSKIKEKDKDSLDRFENIIFSGIVSDEDKLPSTFDGVEQLAKLIKSVRS